MEDKDLLEKLRDPDSLNYGFNLLVHKYEQRVYWHIRKMVIDHNDADDLTQEVFIKIHKHIKNFRQDSQLYTWIYRIATNECLNFLQRKKRRLFLPIGDNESQLAEKLMSSPYISGDEVQLKLQKSLLKLPDKQRLVFNMKYFDDLSYEAIAAITGTSIGALKASYHHAVKKIEDTTAHVRNTKGREKIKAAQAAYVTERLELTSAEAEKFWPVYREYSTRRRGLRQQFNEARRKGEDEKSLIALDLKLKQEALDLEKEYSTLLQETISAEKMIKLRQAEIDFRKLILRQIQQRRK